MKKTVQVHNLNSHLYFTSDEEIKEGDWYIANIITKCDNKYEANDLTDACRKVVATTNKDLALPENALFNFYTDFDYEAIAKRKAEYLYAELIRRGAPRHSALFDVALIALHDKGSDLSDNAAEIITSEKYLNIS